MKKLPTDLNIDSEESFCRLMQPAEYLVDFDRADLGPGSMPDDYLNSRGKGMARPDYYRGRSSIKRNCDFL